jgi:hypothetical protein
MLANAPLDLALILFPSLAFGLFVTAHVALSAALLWRKPRWRGLLALLIPPLAPFWGWSEGLRAWSAVWLVALVAYVAGFAAASAGAA